MARNNYQYEKRQRDIAKKKKQDEKRRRKLNKTSGTGEKNSEITGEDVKNAENEDKTTDNGI
ncbi:MAG: hypothetical protein A2W19_08470 [Spirochaetes bacterium RBG_16_49_21]|nr:MAG: hypothetical protein A2W19_08470 [Spirochaetes bacterium RBG_16_49_21]